jgi:hypothetical protein
MLSALLLLLLLIVGLLAIPISLSFRAGWPQQVPGYLRVRWAFGLLSLEFPSAQGVPEAPQEGPEPKKQKGKKSRRTSPHRGPKLMAAIRQKALRRRILRYLGDCWAAFHKKDVALRLRIGLDDPADTGQLWAVMGPLAALLANTKGASVAIEPQFHEETFELEGRGRVEFVPLRLLTLTLAILFSPTVWQGVRALSREG